MRAARRKEERSKQGQINKKAKQHSTPTAHVHVEVTKQKSCMSVTSKLVTCTVQ